MGKTDVAQFVMPFQKRLLVCVQIGVGICRDIQRANQKFLIIHTILGSDSTSHGQISPRVMCHGDSSQRNGTLPVWTACLQLQFSKAVRIVLV